MYRSQKKNENFAIKFHPKHICGVNEGKNMSRKEEEKARTRYFMQNSDNRSEERG